MTKKQKKIFAAIPLFVLTTAIVLPLTGEWVGSSISSNTKNVEDGTFDNPFTIATTELLTINVVAGDPVIDYGDIPVVVGLGDEWPINAKYIRYSNSLHDYLINPLYQLVHVHGRDSSDYEGGVLLAGDTGVYSGSYKQLIIPDVDSIGRTIVGIAGITTEYSSWYSDWDLVKVDFSNASYYFDVIGNEPFGNSFVSDFLGLDKINDYIINWRGFAETANFKGVLDCTGMLENLKHPVYDVDETFATSSAKHIHLPNSLPRLTANHLSYSFYSEGYGTLENNNVLFSTLINPRIAGEIDLGDIVTGVGGGAFHRTSNTLYLPASLTLNDIYRGPDHWFPDHAKGWEYLHWWNAPNLFNWSSNPDLVAITLPETSALTFIDENDFKLPYLANNSDWYAKTLPSLYLLICEIENLSSQFLTVYGYDANPDYIGNIIVPEVAAARLAKMTKIYDALSQAERDWFASTVVPGRINGSFSPVMGFEADTFFDRYNMLIADLGSKTSLGQFEVTLVVEPSAGIGASISGDVAGTFPTGTPLSFTAHEGINTEFVGWYANGSLVTTSYTVNITVSSHTNLRAVYNSFHFLEVISNDSSLGSVEINLDGTISSINPISNIAFDSHVELYALPNANASFDGFYSDAAMTSLITDRYALNFDLKGDRTIYAKFSSIMPTNQIAFATAGRTGGRIGFVIEDGSSIPPIMGSGMSATSPVQIGKRITLTAVADPGMMFMGWDYTVGNPPFYVNVNDLVISFIATEDVTIYPIFAIATTFDFTFDVGTVSGGSVTSNVGTIHATTPVVEGTSITLTATPNAGFVFIEWTKIGGSNIPLSDLANQTITFTIEDDVTLIAVFDVDLSYVEYAINHSINLGTSAGEIRGPMSGSLVRANSLVTLLAEPATGYEFVTWHLVAGNPTSVTDLLNPFLTFVVTDETTFEAEFRTKTIVPTNTFNLQVEWQGEGRVVGSAGGMHLDGSQIILVAIANENNDFVGWVDGVGNLISKDDCLSFTLTEDRLVIAKFSRVVPPPTLSHPVNLLSPEFFAITFLSVILIVFTIVFIIYIHSKLENRRKGNN